MNPVEDEAVVAAALRMGKGCVELVDVEGDLPGLKYRRGVNDWKIVSKSEFQEYSWPAFQYSFTLFRFF